MTRTREREPWHETTDPDRFARNLGARAAVWTVAALIFLGLLGAIGWGVKVALSDVKGQGDAQVIKNDARNRIRAQEGFEQLYAGIVAADQQIDVADQAAAGSPDDRTLRQNTSGVRQHCLSLRGDYNAKARSFTAEQFRAADLPHQLDATTQTTETDCKSSSGK